VASEIDREVRNLIDNAYQKTTEVLNSNMEQLHIVARYLFEHEKIEAEEFKLLMEGKLKPSENIKMPGDPGYDPEANKKPAPPPAPEPRDEPGSLLDIEG
jgi:cell division protease FtsH